MFFITGLQRQHLERALKFDRELLERLDFRIETPENAIQDTECDVLVALFQQGMDKPISVKDLKSHLGVKQQRTARDLHLILTSLSEKKIISYQVAKSEIAFIAFKNVTIEDAVVLSPTDSDGPSSIAERLTSIAQRIGEATKELEKPAKRGRPSLEKDEETSNESLGHRAKRAALGKLKSAETELKKLAPFIAAIETEKNNQMKKTVPEVVEIAAPEIQSPARLDELTEYSDFIANSIFCPTSPSASAAVKFDAAELTPSDEDVSCYFLNN